MIVLMKEKVLDGFKAIKKHKIFFKIGRKKV